MTASTNDSVAATAASLRTLTRITGILNTSLVLFPHVAILALMGAGPLWWAILAGVTVCLYGMRRQQAAVDRALMAAFWGGQSKPEGGGAAKQGEGTTDER